MNPQKKLRWIFLVSLSMALGAIASDAVAKKPPAPSGPDFDKAAASSALAAVDLTKCKATNTPHGTGHVSITFGTSGMTERVSVDRPPFAATPVGRCVETRYQQATIPAFHGSSVTVGKTFRFD